MMIIAIASSSDKPEEIEENSILTLKMNMPIAERSMDDPFAEIFGEQNAVGIIEIKKALEHAKTDDKIKGLYIQQGRLVNDIYIPNLQAVTFNIY